jgi:hypothetical protein
MGTQQTLHGITAGSKSHQIEMIRALDKMDMRPVIDTSYPFTKIVEAFQFQGEWQAFWQDLPCVLTICCTLGVIERRSVRECLYDSSR